MGQAPAKYPSLVDAKKPEPVREPEQEQPDEGDSDLLRDVAARLMVYIHPAAAKTLKRYAVEQSGHKAYIKVHDIVIEALSEWMERRGLPGPVRAKEPVKPPKKARR
jgi:hypothetical protein